MFRMQGNGFDEMISCIRSSFMFQNLTRDSKEAMFEAGAGRVETYDSNTHDDIRKRSVSTAGAK